MPTDTVSAVIQELKALGLLVRRVTVRVRVMTVFCRFSGASAPSLPSWAAFRGRYRYRNQWVVRIVVDLRDLPDALADANTQWQPVRSLVAQIDTRMTSLVASHEAVQTWLKGLES